MDLNGWLSWLKEKSAPRPLLVQHHDKDVWHEWPCGHGEPIHTRTILTNELVFECDDPPANTPEGWTAQVSGWRKLFSTLPVPGVFAYGGNKSFHLHVFLNLWTDDPDLLDYGRSWLLKTLEDMTGCGLKFDLAVTRWSHKTKGHMVREFGSVKPGTSIPKTYLSPTLIPEERITSTTVRLPPRPPEFWTVKEKVVRAIIKDHKDYKEALARASNVPSGSGNWRSLISRRWLGWGEIWTPGTRHTRAGICAMAMLTAGLTLEQAKAELQTLRDHVNDPSYPFHTWETNADYIYAHGKTLKYSLGDPPPKQANLEEVFSAWQQDRNSTNESKTS